MTTTRDERIGNAGSIVRLRSADSGPAPVGPYSQASGGGGLIFVSGQIPAVTGLDDQPEDFTEQVQQTLRNLAAALDGLGSGIGRILKVNAYLTDKSQLGPFNDVFAEFFGDIRPSRTTVCVELWDVSLEVECIALGPDVRGQR
ncbi:RidA family protein [Rhodococcus koreensis]